MTLDVKNKANELSLFLAGLSEGSRNEYIDITRPKIVDSSPHVFSIPPRNTARYGYIADFYVPRWGLLESARLEIPVERLYPAPGAITSRQVANNGYDVDTSNAGAGVNSGLVPVSNWPAHIIEYFEWVYGGNVVLHIPGEILQIKYDKMDFGSESHEKEKKKLKIEVGGPERVADSVAAAAGSYMMYYVTVPSFFEASDALQPIDTLSLRHELVLRVKFRTKRAGLEVISNIAYGANSNVFSINLNEAGGDYWAVSGGIDSANNIFQLGNVQMKLHYVTLREPALSQVKGLHNSGFRIKMWVPQMVKQAIPAGATSAEINLRALGLTGHCQQLLIFMRSATRESTMQPGSDTAFAARYRDLREISTFRMNSSGYDFIDTTGFDLEFLDVHGINPRPRVSKVYVLDFQTHPRNVWMDEMMRLNGVMGSLFIEGMNDPRLFITFPEAGAVDGSLTGERDNVGAYVPAGAPLTLFIFNLKHYVIKISNNDIVALADI